MPVIEVDLIGPIFQARQVERIIGQEIGKILDEAALSGETAVKQQLFPGPPPHGVVTGFLRESITGTRVDSLHTIIDAGQTTQGSQVVYARRIEGLYHMFFNAWQLLRNKNLPELLAKRVTRRLNL